MIRVLNSGPRNRQAALSIRLREFATERRENGAAADTPITAFGLGLRARSYGIDRGD